MMEYLEKKDLKNKKKSLLIHIRYSMRMIVVLGIWKYKCIHGVDQYILQVPRRFSKVPLECVRVPLRHLFRHPSPARGVWRNTHSTQVLTRELLHLIRKKN